MAEHYNHSLLAVRESQISQFITSKDRESLCQTDDDVFDFEAGLGLFTE